MRAAGHGGLVSAATEHFGSAHATSRRSTTRARGTQAPSPLPADVDDLARPRGLDRGAQQAVGGIGER
jgi:hypothetical protein